MFDLSVENFKCFKKEKVSFAELTILAGANASGKSSIIQALLLIRKFFAVNANLLKGVGSKGVRPLPIDLNPHYGLRLINSNDILHHDFSDELIRFSLHDHKCGAFKIECPVSDNKGEGGTVQMTVSEDYQIDETFIEGNPLVGDKSFYYLCAERVGPRTFQHLSDGSNAGIGYQGEYMAHMMASQYGKKILERRCFPFSQNTNFSFQEQMNLWLDYIIPSAKANAEILKSRDLAFVTFTHGNYPQYGISPTNTGFGISYFLPIVGCCLLAPENSMVIIENPEAHLSPKGQSHLGIFLGCMAKTGLKIIIETHSDHIINGVRLAVKKQIIDSNKVLINYFDLSNDNIYPSIKSIKVDKDAKLSSWPSGFFDQIEQDLIDINHPTTNEC